MNLHDLFWSNESLVKSTQAMLLEFLTKRAQGPVSAKPPVMRKADADFPVTSLCLLRLNDRKNHAPIIIGSSQADFHKKFYEVVAPLAGAPTVEPKTVENDLLKALYMTVDADLKTKNQALDPKTALVVIQKNLGAWSNIAVQNAVQFPFDTAHGELVFEIPIVTEEFAISHTRASYGFPINARILVVDDAPTTRKLVCHLLASVGYLHFEECVDGVAAFNKLLMSKPPCDLVIADWHMPNMTGIEMLRKIRGTVDPIVKATPILLVTGEQNKDEVMKAIREGVNGYVVKPFDGETLYAAMNKAAKTAAQKKAA